MPALPLSREQARWRRQEPFVELPALRRELGAEPLEEARQRVAQPLQIGRLVEARPDGLAQARIVP